MQKTIDFLKDRDIKFNVVGDRIIINNGYLHLNDLTSIDKDIFKNTTINGYLSLDGLTSVDKDFLKDTTVNGGLSLYSITSVDKDFLKNTTINGDLYLNSLTSIDDDFLKDTTINGKLYFKNLNEGNNHIKKFDGIWNKIYSTHQQGDYIIHKVNNGFVVEKDNTYAHGESIKTAIRDLEFKISDRNFDDIKDLDINQEMTHDELYLIYRLVTGACSQGTEMFMSENDISNIKTIKDVIDITTELNSYGCDTFKEFYKEC